jgi:hypothetical protein
VREIAVSGGTAHPALSAEIRADGASGARQSQASSATALIVSSDPDRRGR